MRVVVVHADYLEPGGETVSAMAEVDALRAAGHDVIPFFRSNASFSDASAARKTIDLFWNQRVASELAQLLDSIKPDIVHCNNLFPSLSPSVYHAAHRSGAATVQTLRNYRLLCPASNFFRDGAPCYDCRDRYFALPGVSHSCYRSSRLATAGTASMTSLHRALGTWRRIDAFIVLSERAKELLSTSMLPPRVYVKYNVVLPEPEVGRGELGDVLFVGRLTLEKGVEIVLDAAKRSPLPITIIGNGAMADQVIAAADRGHLTYIPQLEHSDLMTRMGQARAVLALPLWDEPFGRTVAESLGSGTPAVVTPFGALADFVQDGVSGFVVSPSDSGAVNKVLAQLAGLDDRATATMRHAARVRYEQLFSPMANVAQLIDIYSAALDHRSRHGRRVRP